MLLPTIQLKAAHESILAGEESPAKCSKTDERQPTVSGGLDGGIVNLDTVGEF